MKSISPEQLLNQIRTLNAELQVKPQSGAPEAGGIAFGDFLQKSINAVNETQQASAALKSGFTSGTGDASLVEVMVAAQKADLSFRAMTEVRNKLVTAYQEIMNMPV